ncbi:MAG: hypothetical protein WCS69_15785 [Ignavibacteriaceae bacterium]|jgi:hypothetical protein
MALTQEQKTYLDNLCLSLSIDSLLQLKKGNINGIDDFNTKLIDSDLISEHKEMKEIIKKHINIKNRKNST